MKETFTYNDMNRLTGITLKRSSGQELHCGVSYDALGRMTSRQSVTTGNSGPQVSTVFSQPAFDATKVHALATVQSTSDLFPPAAQSITYTSFEKASKIKLGMDSICYTYGYDHQRISMEEHIGSSLRTKQYVGGCEYITETGTSGTKKLTYLTGPYGVFAVIEKQNGVQTPHYVLKDNLGSWTTITNGSGTVEQRLSYDAWGNQRNPNTWANYTAGDCFDKPMFERGFTGHEHLTAFDLINMNGRMYDPVMSSFLSADRFVQNPMSAQGFNRYAYCMNNPLRYVDPTGWLSGGGGGTYGEHPPGVPYYVDGNLTIDLLEVTILADNPSLSNTNQYEGFEYTPNITSGGFDNGWGGTRGWSSSGHSGGSGGGNGNHGGSSNVQQNQNTNLEIASKVLITANLYTTIEASLYFNELTRKWKDKLDIIRDFDFYGNQYTGGKNSYGKMMSNKFTNAGRVLGFAGAAISLYQCHQATTIEGQLEYGFDAFLGLAGVIAPEVFGIPSTIWFLGGKQITFWYGRTVITPMIENGLNPGLIEYQPFK